LKSSTGESLTTIAPKDEIKLAAYPDPKKNVGFSFKCLSLLLL